MASNLSSPRRKPGEGHARTWFAALAVALIGSNLPVARAFGQPAPVVSAIQALVDAAPAGGTVRIPAGVYRGDLTIDRPITLVGIGRPTLVGSGTGSVVRIRANDVTFEGFDIDGLDAGNLAEDPSGIHVSAVRAAVRDCRIERTLFGVYLHEAHDSTVERCVIEGAPWRDPGDQGSGIHLFNTTGFTLADNVIRYSRDGLYLQNSSRGLVRGNRVSDVRYGLHYMYSDDNVFEDNLFERSAAGAALMYSVRLTFRRNRFLHNRGFASVGLLMQGCDDVVAEDNLIADNARGVFLEGSSRDVFRRNVIATSDTAIVLYDSVRENRFEGNVFVGNLSPLVLVGRRTDTVFIGNYWSDHDEPDLDGDGVRDRPYRLSNVFDHIRGNLTAADLFAQGLGARALGAAEHLFPVLEAASVVDDRPLARPPALPSVPAPPPAAHGTFAGVGVSLFAAVSGALVLGMQRRRPR
jgi:nitrous oxidase accessory protein